MAMLLSNFVGIKYRDKGRTFHGADCWGIVMLYFQEFHKIDIPEVNATGETPRKAFSEYLYQISHYWVECKEFKKDYVVAMCSNPNHPKLVTHFGVMVSDTHILHTFKGVESHIVDIKSPMIKNQIKGIYKWRY